MKISSLLSFQFKYCLLLFLQQFKKLSYFKNFNLESKRRKAFFFLAADYGNLGDCAITVAQIRFIENNSDYQVVEIPISQTAEGIIFTKKNISKNDIIVTVGGGNMGEMYDQIEFLRQLVIKKFRKNKIISFPQTFDFSNSLEGQQALEKAKKIYSSHKNLHLIAREKTSFQKMKESFTENYIYLTPDIVLSLQMNSQEQRHGTVICMRSDDEKRLSKQQNEDVINLIKHHFSDFKYFDTHIGNIVLSTEERLNQLEKIWKQFSRSELVITDRLHGMIFCYITNTPAIVFQNSNHKVKETYEWIKHRGNIILVQDFDIDFISSTIKDRSTNVKWEEKNLDYEPLINLLK